jgi:RNA polymerase sigma-70 factor (ECF subfamily)
LRIDTETTYRRYGPMVLRRCRRLLRDEDKARDAMHDVFVQLMRHEERLSSEGTSSLLFRIATNVCLNRIRSERRRPEDADEERLHRIAGTGDLEAGTAARRLLGRLFGEEPESTRLIAVLHLYDEMTLEEVAEVVGMSVSGVRKRLRRLREKLPPAEERR